MVNEFKNKTAVITGGASGIGLLCGQNLAEKGANVLLVDINEEALKVMVTAYAQARGTDTETCIEKALYYHRLSHPQA